VRRNHFDVVVIKGYQLHPVLAHQYIWSLVR
jgi:hypothetical protein